MPNLYIVSSDWHVIDGSPQEPCDRQKVQRLVDTVIQRKASELILAGDIVDVTRAGDGCIPGAAAWLGAVVGRPLSAAGIRTTFILGNHDWIGAQTSKLARALYTAGFAPELFTVSTGPEFRDPWLIEHGHRFDPFCQSENWRTPIGELFTRLDWYLDHVGIDLEQVNPSDWAPREGSVPAIDMPFHRDAMRWAAATGSKLIVGHSHMAADVGGRVGARDWRLLDCGAAVKSAPFSFVWITDQGEAGVEI